jgi:hypothetical protein
MNKIIQYLADKLESYSGARGFLAASLNAYLQSLQFKMKPWGQTLRKERCIIWVGVDIELIQISGQNIYGFKNLTLDPTNFVASDIDIGEDNLAINCIDTERLNYWANVYEPVALIIGENNNDKLCLEILCEYDSIKSICFLNDDIDNNKNYETYASTLIRRTPFGKVIAWDLPPKIVFGEFFDNVLKKISNELCNDPSSSVIKYVNITSEAKISGDIKKYNFNNDISEKLEFFPEDRLDKDYGKYAIIHRANVFNNIIADCKGRLYPEFLMTNDLARGFNYYLELNLVIKKKRSGTINLFLQKFGLDGSIKFIDGIYLRASVPSPALSHWLIDDLLPFMSLKLLHPDLKMLYSGTLTSYQRYHLQAFGIEKSVVEVDSNSNLYVENLFVVDKFYNLDPVFSFSSIQYHSLNKFIQNKLNLCLTLSKVDKIYVSRRDAKKSRILLNEEDVEKFLINKGYKVVVGSNYSGEQLAQIYSKAKIVVGPLGAGLLNTLFSPENIKILALTSPGYYEAHLAQISKLRGNSYRYLIGDEISAEDDIEGGIRNSNYFIPLEQLAKEIDLIEAE